MRRHGGSEVVSSSHGTGASAAAAGCRTTRPDDQLLPQYEVLARRGGTTEGQSASADCGGLWSGC